MAAMEACDTFTLNYCKETTVNLFRKGCDEEPIPPDLTRRCRRRREWQMGQKRMNRERNSEGRRHNLRPVDFILDDEDGQILPEESSGTNELMSSYVRFLDPYVVRFWEKFFCGKHSIRLLLFTRIFMGGRHHQKYNDVK